MLLQALSLGCEVDVWRPRMGVVHSVFERVVNLLVNGEMWTVLGAAGADVPFGIRVDAGAGQFAVKSAERVHVRAGFVSVGKLNLDCRTAARWAPTRWMGPATGLAVRLSAVQRAALPRAWAESGGMASDVMDALGGSDADLAAAIRRTVGHGPGLTPAGDDVLAGILALFTSRSADAEGACPTSRLVRALAPALSSTTEISRHLLQQAARGLPGRALHELGRAVIEGAPGESFAAALALVLDTGATSGADACLGFAAACRSFFLNTELAAA